MANYTTLKTAIQAVIRTNGNEEITGALLQQSLLAMIDSLGVGYQFMGVATTNTVPGTPDQNVFYLAFDVGTYINFGGTSLGNGQIGVFSYNGNWTYIVKTIGQGGGGAPVWGNITGTLADQTDLQDALDAKAGTDITGSLANLNTTVKTNLVAAINEVQAEGGGGSAGNPIVGIDVPTPYDGTVIFTYKNGDTTTLDLNHSHPQYEDVSNKVTSLSAQSTDTQYPSAKCVYDIIGDVESLLAAL